MKTLRNFRLAGGAAALFLCGCASFNPFAQKTTPSPEPASPPAAARPVDSTRLPAPAADIIPVMAENLSDASASSSQLALQQHTVCDEGYDSDVSLDSTGKWMTFASTRHSEHPNIYLQRVDGASVIQLTADGADNVQPAFSPDGKRIAFASNRCGNWDIFIMDTDGRNVEQITSGSSDEMHPSFSPDGGRLAYCGPSRRGEQWELWTISIATRERKMIGLGMFPAWSPRKDLDRIAFQRPRLRGSRAYSLWTLDLVDGEPRRLTEISSSSNAAVICPAWSPDGQRLSFATVLIATDSNRPRQDIWVISSDGSGRQRLTNGSGTNLSPFWSVDNRIYFVSDRGGRENIWSVLAEPGQSGTVTADAGHGASKSQIQSKPGDVQGAKTDPPAPNAGAPRLGAPNTGTADTRETGH